MQIDKTFEDFRADFKPVRNEAKSKLPGSSVWASHDETSPVNPWEETILKNWPKEKIWMLDWDDVFSLWTLVPFRGFGRPDGYILASVARADNFDKNITYWETL